MATSLIASFVKSGATFIGLAVFSNFPIFQYSNIPIFQFFVHLQTETGNLVAFQSNFIHFYPCVGSWPRPRPLDGSSAESHADLTGSFERITAASCAVISQKCGAQRHLSAAAPIGNGRAEAQDDFSTASSNPPKISQRRIRGGRAGGWSRSRRGQWEGPGGEISGDSLRNFLAAMFVARMISLTQWIFRGKGGSGDARGMLGGCWRGAASAGTREEVEQCSSAAILMIILGLIVLARG